MLAAILISAVILIVLFAAIALCRFCKDKIIPQESYEDMILRLAEHDFQESLTKIDGWNDDVVIDWFENKYIGKIEKTSMHVYIGRLMQAQQEAQESLLGIGS